MDLNADMAEGSGPQGWAADAALLDVVTSANIAGGGHAGDAETMRRACDAALERGVRIGAHPGYRDRENFGRAELELATDEVITQVAEQIALLEGIAASSGGAVTHVKLHGALYHRALGDTELAQELADLIARLGHPPAVLAPASGALAGAARELKLRCAAEGFADRAYGSDGLLVARDQPGSLLGAEEAVAQALRLASDGEVIANDGTVIPVDVESICVHGDRPGAIELAGELRVALTEGGIELKAFV